MRACITYLTQSQHSSYGADRTATLQRSLLLLHEHYNRRFGHDVLLFHTGESTARALAARVLAPLGEAASHARFVRVPERHWRLPTDVAPHLATANRSSWYAYPRFSLGYRHMIRWFVVGLWEVLEQMGYDWTMRLDDDSLLLSPISYDLFGWLAARNVAFGYRLASFESGFDGERFHTFVRRFLLSRARNASSARRHAMQRLGPQQFARALRRNDSAWRCPECKPAWLLDTCGNASTIRDFSLRQCGELYGMYNNLFVASVAFWRSAAVQRFVRHVDGSGHIYTRRYGDLPLQSVAVQTYLPKARVHMFTDWSYMHGTTMSRAAYESQQSPPQTTTITSAAAAATAAANAAPASLPFSTLPWPRPPESSTTALIGDTLNLSSTCIIFGGVAAGTDDASGYAMVRDLVRAGAFCRPPCLRLFAHRKRLVLAATAGDVKVEQPDCAREPPPYHCLAASALVAHAAHDASGGAPPAARSSSAIPMRARTTWQQRTLLDGSEAAPLTPHANASTVLRLLGGTNASTELWARAALSLAPLGTCALPPAVRLSPCGDAIRQIRAHTARHNLASGIRFGCPSSIHRYLVACRPEAGCAAAAEPWYLGREELACEQRAVVRLYEQQAPPAAQPEQPRDATRRHHWLRHQCERLSSLPLTGSIEAPRAPKPKLQRKQQRREQRELQRARNRSSDTPRVVSTRRRGPPRGPRLIDLAAGEMV